MLVYHLVNPDLKIQIFFEKEGAEEKEGIDFEKRDIDTSECLYWGLKKN